ncbi:SGNH/GDSL hydrolase family protein [Corynebacterium sp. A21]|uniref:SGNH/GDSL hydrolase family protein n=1 Tax=Corynebacterium sp. A21 TaxID=3457318 RepID=UPI003FD5C56F
MKEQRGQRVDFLRPSKQYLERTDGSLDDIDYRLATDQHGFICGGGVHDPRMPSLYVIGDSFVESSYSIEEKRFAAQIDRCANLNVYNAGYSGTTMLQACLMIFGKLPTLAKPGDHVLLFSPFSDALAYGYPGGYWNDSKTYAPILPLNVESSWEGRLSDAEALLNAVKVFLDGIGINFSLALTPRREGDFNTDSWLRITYSRNRRRYGRALALKKEYESVIRQIGQDADYPFLDLSSYLDNPAGYFYDELHLNSAGQDIIAQRVLAFIKEELHY